MVQELAGRHAPPSTTARALSRYLSAHLIDSDTLPRRSHSRQRNRLCRSSTFMDAGSRSPTTRPDAEEIAVAGDPPSGLTIVANAGA